MMMGLGAVILEGTGLLTKSKLNERMNQTLKGALQKLVNENQEDWYQLLDNVLFAYRTSRQAVHTLFSDVWA